MIGCEVTWQQRGIKLILSSALFGLAFMGVLPIPVMAAANCPPDDSTIWKKLDVYAECDPNDGDGKRSGTSGKKCMNLQLHGEGQKAEDCYKRITNCDNEVTEGNKKIVDHNANVLECKRKAEATAPNTGLAFSGSDNQKLVEFLKSVGCSKLPMGTCEFLNPDNARNIMLTWNAVIFMGICGTSNPHDAKQLLDNDAAADPAACRELLGMHGIR
jgi:hypothetical protein